MPSEQTPNDDPFRAHELLVAYQRSKDFGRTGYLTSQVVALIVLDYLSPVSQNGGKADPGKSEYFTGKTDP